MLPMSLLQRRGTIDWAVPQAQLEELILSANKAAAQEGIQVRRARAVLACRPAGLCTPGEVAWQA